MLSAMCIMIAPLVLLFVRNRILLNCRNGFHTKDIANNLYRNILSYIFSLLVINGLIILILQFLFHGYAHLSYRLNHNYVFACKYLALSMLLACVLPFLEKIIRLIHKNAIRTLTKLPEESRAYVVYNFLKNNTFFKWVVICQIIMAVFICWLSVRPQYSYTFDVNNLISCHKHLQMVSNGYQITDLKAGETAATVLKTIPFRLAPGAYEITAKYSVGVKSDKTASFSNNEGKLNLASVHHGHCYSWKDAIYGERRFQQTSDIN